MPQPPLLEVIDWPAVFESGLDYAEWLAQAESADRRQAMEDGLAAQTLPAATAAALGALPRPVHVVAIAEDWCGDVVRHAPTLQKMAEAAPNLRVRYISRAQHPNVFVRFLTNGGEAIPQFVFFNHAFTQCGHWGPMPAAGKELIARGKAAGDVGAARKKVSLLYEADVEKQEVVRELMALVDIAAG